MSTIILIDDDAGYARSFKDDAYDVGLKVEHYFTLNEAIEEIKSQPDLFSFAIIDAQGQIEEDSKANDPSHLMTAILAFSSIENEGIHIPFAINTAFAGSQFPLIPKQIKRFSKNNDEDKLFEFIKDCVNQANLIAIQFPKEFSAFEYLDNLNKNEYIKTATSYLKKEFTDIKGYAAGIRTIQVAIFNKIKEMYPDIAPGECFEDPNDKSKVVTIIKQLSGKDHTNDIDYLEDDMRNLVKFLYFQCSTIIHYGEKKKEEILYIYSKNIFPLLFLALNEFLLWYLHFIEKAKK